MTEGGPPGPRSLWLLRHAKAVGPTAGGTDHDRVLTPRGRRDARSLGARLPALGLEGVALPGAIFCSTAARTTETAAGVAGGLGVDVDRRRSLYYASPEGVLDEIRTTDGSVRSLLVVGHNPTTHVLALGLLAEDDPDRARLSRFPTCALAVFRLDAACWADVAQGAAVLAGFFTPPY